MLAGYVEPAHFDNFQFENQRRTFHSYGEHWSFCVRTLRGCTQHRSSPFPWPWI